MAIFSVNYDLYFPKEYKEFYDALESYPHAHVMDSCWLIEAQGDAKSIRDTLMPHLNSNDSLFVARISEDWAGAGTQCGEWLNGKDRAFG